MNGIRYGILADSGADYALENRGNVATLRVDTRNAYFRSHRQGAEFKMAYLMAACRDWVEGKFRPLEIRFAHPRSSSIPEFSKSFGCPVSFSSETTEVLFDPAMLSLRMCRPDPHLLALLTRFGDELLSARSSSATPLRSRVERLVIEALPRGAPEASQVASALAMSERTLARQLSKPRARATSGSSMICAEMPPRATSPILRSRLGRLPICSATPSKAHSQQPSGGGLGSHQEPTVQHAPSRLITPRPVAQRRSRAMSGWVFPDRFARPISGIGPSASLRLHQRVADRHGRDRSGSADSSSPAPRGARARRRAVSAGAWSGRSCLGSTLLPAVLPIQCPAAND